MALDRRWFFQVTAEAFEHADSAFLCLFNTVVFSFFLPFECPSRFFEKFVAGLVNKCPVKEILVTKR